MTTPNDFAVSLGPSGHVHVLGLVVLSQKMAAGGLSEDEALNLAAWLVASVPGDDAAARFVTLYNAIREGEGR